ncbi:MAG: hypothetical protein CM15mP92_2630 [Halieaceae bacterium]|nr:MAG: hypothetical protein CM15mP92_2630 [Halieaceae bacterium]
MRSTPLTQGRKALNTLPITAAVSAAISAPPHSSLYCRSAVRRDCGDCACSSRISAGRP